MMTASAYRQLAALISDVHELIDRVQAGASSEEIELRVTSAGDKLDALQATIEVGPTGPFNDMARHLHFLLHYHRKSQPAGYATDLADLRERDLPGVIRAVEEWATQEIDPGLVLAITPSWDAHHYGNAVRCRACSRVRYARSGAYSPSLNMRSAICWSARSVSAMSPTWP
jgi:hypothetical protein